MKIVVIGGTGRLGGAVVRAAAGRAHEVVALGSADVDATDPASVRKVAAGHDAVVVSVKGPDQTVSRAAQAMLDAEVERFVFVGGAGSLLAPSGQQFLDTQDVPPPIRAASLDQAAALALLRAAETSARWSYLSPPPVRLVDGDGSGQVRAEARDTPLLGPGPDAQLSVDDLATAIVDALEQDSFAQQRFTVGPA